MPVPPVKQSRGLLQDGVVGDTGPVFRDTKNGFYFAFAVKTRGLSDFSHIVAALINVPPLAQQTLSCYKCAFSMQGMCAGAPPLPV